MPASDERHLRAGRHPLVMEDTRDTSRNLYLDYVEAVVPVSTGATSTARTTSTLSATSVLSSVVLSTCTVLLSVPTVTLHDVSSSA